MTTITTDVRLDSVEHILANGSGTLDFAVAGEDGYTTWRGTEDADWNFDDVGGVENVDEDRFIVYPDGEYFVCDVNAAGEEQNPGPVECWCE
jgi:hypothetical protein